jgi:hypothetical protein
MLHFQDSDDDNDRRSWEDHMRWRLDPSVQEGADGGKSPDDASYGRDDGQGQQHLHHLPPTL